MDSFKLTERLDYFKDEATCVAYLEQQRRGGTSACPFCGVAIPIEQTEGLNAGIRPVAKSLALLLEQYMKLLKPLY
ncbi:MAG TPA: hypothetical protein VG890_03375 [Puia sp.]|nr:hypothetical protein [Puia sp.]